MSIVQVALLSLVLIAHRLFFDLKYRRWVIFFASLVLIFWFQPATPIRNLSYWFPVIGIGLSIVAWISITDSSRRFSRENLFTFLLIILLTLLIHTIKYLRIEGLYKFSSTPDLKWTVLFWSLISIIAIISRQTKCNRLIRSAFIFVIITILIVLKSPDLSIKVGQILRKINNQDIHLASSLDLQWVGFSYLGFRIIHVLRDHQLNKKNPTDLRDFFNYLFFFPSFIAGPIDRIERFNSDIAKNNLIKDDNLIQGIHRIVIGSAKKFILADSLALMGISEYSIGLVNSSIWMWVLVIAYGFRIYFDFSGYTDIAVGMAKLIGISLPENFMKPYSSRNLIMFWNNWHITLTQWFRTYYFNPINRFFRAKNVDIPQWILIFLMQLSTMILIGLWHGITLNFIVWGLWHGLGLFFNNRWINMNKKFGNQIEGNPFINPILKYMSITVTFIFISIGWIWFALPTLDASWIVFKKLFGG